MNDAECEEFISAQLEELGGDSGIIVQPEGSSKQQFQRVAESMGLQVSDELPVECTAGVGMPKAMRRPATPARGEKEGSRAQASRIRAEE